MKGKQRCGQGGSRCLLGPRNWLSPARSPVHGEPHFEARSGLGAPSAVQLRATPPASEDLDAR